MAKQKARANQAEAAEGAEYTVVARRYRPQQFTDLIGQEPVARALMNAIQSDRVAHAYLFTGARGTGKTSTARILAKALNCEKGPTPTPCDQCETCKSIMSGEDIDVLEIDGASNNGVDEIRNLRQNVATRPARSRYKIYIIDEVHMLTKAAFNALLKTLEEPPPHVKFIFATTEYEKIPLTIRSRCQRFDFSGISSVKIVESLKKIVATEGMKAEDAALAIVARRAGGSMRDAQSLLDQLLAIGGELTVANVHEMLGTATDDRMLALVDAIAAKDPKKAFELLGRYADEGLQLGELLDQLVEYWRGLMVLNCAGKEFADLWLAEANRDKACQQAQGLPLDAILAGLDVLTTTKNRLRGSNHGLVLLEMAVLRLIRLDELLPLSQLIQSLNQPGLTLPAGPARAVPAADAGKKNSLANPEPAAPKVPAPSTNGVSVGSSIAEIWPRVREEVGAFLGGNLDVAGLPAILGPKALVLSFSSRYTAQHDYCSEPNSILEVQNALKKVTGQDWTVRVDIQSSGETLAEKKSAESKPDQKVAQRSRSQEVLQIPIVGRAVDKLGARVLKVEEGFGSSEAVVPEADAIEPGE